MLSRIPSIHKKQIVAVTGVMLIGFLLAHLTGNFLIFKGPDALNNYAKFLKSLGGLLWAMRIGLILSFVTHMFFTALLVIENRKARGGRYAVNENHRGKSSLASKTMPYTGTVILVYLVFHLLDFTFAEHTGVINGQDLGLYGLVVNTLSQPLHAGLYIAAMIGIGLHLSHSVQSVFQTFGLNNDLWLPRLEKLSLAVGIIVALGYSSIPVYILSM